jgi:hypothetical protein
MIDKATCLIVSFTLLLQVNDWIRIWDPGLAVPDPGSIGTNGNSNHSDNHCNGGSTRNHCSTIKEDRTMKQEGDNVAGSPITPAQPAHRHAQINGNTPVAKLQTKNGNKNCTNASSNLRNNNDSSDSSFEDTIGLMQELF